MAQRFDRDDDIKLELQTNRNDEKKENQEKYTTIGEQYLVQ